MTIHIKYDEWGKKAEREELMRNPVPGAIHSGRVVLVRESFIAYLWRRLRNGFPC